MTGKRWLATLIVVLTACTPPGERVPLTGNVTLKYTGPSPSYDAAVFTLANGTSRSIYFRGIPSPRQWNLRCINSNSAVGYGPGFIDPPPREEDIEVASGEGMRFALYYIEADIKSTDGTCQLKLTMTDGTVIESPEFDATQASRAQIQSHDESTPTEWHIGSTWAISVFGSEHQPVGSMLVRLTGKTASSCIDGDWRQIEILKRQFARNESLATRPLSYSIEANKLTLGVTEVCDGYVFLRGVLSNSGASGDYGTLGLEGFTKLGSFTAVAAKD